MASYELTPRFKLQETTPYIFEPGAYQNKFGCVLRKNKFPFNSSTKRKTLSVGPVYAEALYYPEYHKKIPLGTSLKSKTPRFPYDSFTKEDLERLLCQCGLDLPCECEDDFDKEKLDPVVCQAKVKRTLFVGRPPRSATSLLKKPEISSGPDFYDAAVNEFTKHYHGWKWSQWTSKRTPTSNEVRPGPADYDLEKKTTHDEICLELTRHYKRKTSRQLRFIEQIQQRNLLEDLPGPASYDVKLPKSAELKFLGSKADRFKQNKIEISPSPGDHWITRFGDLPKCLSKISNANLPKRAPFGVNAPRFRYRQEEGPSPDSYTVKNKICTFTHCPTSGFSSSAKRWKDPPIEDSDEEDLALEKESLPPCPQWTWQFRSKSKRFSPLMKKLNEPSPADLLLRRNKKKRSLLVQRSTPFHTSEGRFQPWYDWLPIQGLYKVPGPADYFPRKPQCYPAFNHGPLFRAPRFRQSQWNTPAPNAYKIEGDEYVLKTFNQRLKENINKVHKFKWEPRPQPPRYTLEELEANLLDKTIALLDDEKETQIIESKQSKVKSKFLRCFL